MEEDKKALDVLNLLTKSAMPHVILAVGKNKLINFSKIQAYVITLNGPTNPGTVKSRLDELKASNLLDTKPIPDRERDESTYHAKPLLELIGERIAYLFDETKEFIGVQKEDYFELARKLKVDNRSIEDWMAQKIQEFLEG